MNTALQKLTFTFVLACLWFAVSGCMHPLQVASPPAEPVAESKAVRFPRADLVDVAIYVSERVGKGFVLANPELRTLPITLYIPGEPSTEVLEKVFMGALQAQGLGAIEQDGYWVITFTSESRLGDPESVTLDFRETPLSEATAFMSRATGKQFIIDGVANHRVTLQALRPVERTAAFDLFIKSLETAGLSVQQEGEVVVIQAPRGGQTSGSSEGGSGYGVF